MDDAGNTHSISFDLPPHSINVYTQHRLETFCASLRGLAEVFAGVAAEAAAGEVTEAHKPLHSPEEIAEIVRCGVIDRMIDGPTGAPKWSYIYAERCAAAVWGTSADFLNALDRVSRHGVHSPDHRRLAFEDYAADAWRELERSLYDAAGRATRAYGALGHLHPGKTPAELCVMVLRALQSVLECPHPPAVQSEDGWMY